MGLLVKSPATKKYYSDKLILSSVGKRFAESCYESRIDNYIKNREPFELERYADPFDDDNNQFEQMIRDEEYKKGYDLYS